MLVPTLLYSSLFVLRLDVLFLLGLNIDAHLLLLVLVELVAPVLHVVAEHIAQRAALACSYNLRLMLLHVLLESVGNVLNVALGLPVAHVLACTLATVVLADLVTRASNGSGRTKALRMEACKLKVLWIVSPQLVADVLLWMLRTAPDTDAYNERLALPAHVVGIVVRHIDFRAHQAERVLIAAAIHALPHFLQRCFHEAHVSFIVHNALVPLHYVLLCTSACYYLVVIASVHHVRLLQLVAHAAR